MPKNKKNKNKPIKPVLHIFTEGEKTEPYYINGRIDDKYSEYRTIVVIEKTKKNTPVQLVEEAIKHQKSEKLKQDVYWVVFDRESIAKYSDERHLKARRLAQKHDINIAFSNICFEYWLLLHFEFTTACYASCDDLLTNSNLKNHLKTVGIAKYDKAIPNIYALLREKFDDAITHSKRTTEIGIQNANHGAFPHQINPFINVYELFEAIEDFTNC